MKTSMLAGVLILLSFSSMAQFSIQASVMDSKTRSGLRGATIKIAERIFTTNDNGQVEISNFPAGEYDLEIKFLGYETRRMGLTLHQNEVLQIFLNETATVTDEVVIYATRANDKTPTTFTTVDQATIQKQNFGQDLPILLNWTPSVVTTSDAGSGVGYTGMRIRGSDATRINVTINGIPYNDSESQGTFWVDIPDVASSTQSIQIQRGVGTSTNGGSAFGASVNLQTNSLSSDPYADATVAVGSFGTQRYTARAGTGLLNNHWAFDAKVSKILSNGYVDRASSDLSSYYISGGYYGEKTILKGVTFGGHEVTYQSWYGVDEAMLKADRQFNYAGAIYDASFNVVRYYDNQVDDYRQDHYQLHLTQQLNDSWTANVSGHFTYGRGFYEEYHQGDSLKYLGLPDVVIGDTTIEAMDVIVRKWLDNKFYGATFSLNFEKGKTNFILGGAFNQYGHAKHFGEILWAQYADNVEHRHHYYEGRSQKNDFNVYAKLNYDMTPNLNAFVDLQYRYVEYKTSGIRDDQSPYDVHEKFNFFNPKVGLSYSVTDNGVVYVSYAIAHREPNRSDYLDGDVKPKLEKLGNMELGWRAKFSSHRFEVNYYLMHYNDQLVLTGELDNTGFPIRANVGKSYRTGIEATASIQLVEKLQWDINATLSSNKNVDFVVLDESNEATTKNTTIILSPSIISGSQLTYSPWKNFQASWLAKYVGEQYLDNTQNRELMLEGYFINDLRFNYSLGLKDVKAVDVSLLVNNVFDVEYESNGYLYFGTPYYFPQAGINFMAMLSLKF